MILKPPSDPTKPQLLEYKGYIGTVEYSRDNKVWHGKIKVIRKLVTYESKEIGGIVAAFQKAVDSYLNTKMK